VPKVFSTFKNETVEKVKREEKEKKRKSKGFTS
jgi:hypothetical protein